MRAQWHPRCTRFSFIPASLLIKALQNSLSLCGHLGPHVGGGERQLSCRVTADGMALTLKHSGGLGLSSLELPASIRAMTARLTPRWWLLPCPKSSSLGGLFPCLINLAIKTVFLAQHQDVGGGCLWVEESRVAFSLLHI